MWSNSVCFLNLLEEVNACCLLFLDGGGSNLNLNIDVRTKVDPTIIGSRPQFEDG